MQPYSFQLILTEESLRWNTNVPSGAKVLAFKVQQQNAVSSEFCATLYIVIKIKFGWTGIYLTMLKFQQLLSGDYYVRWNENYSVGIGRGLFKKPSWYFPEEIDENHSNISLVCFAPEIFSDKKVQCTKH
jgi:hypothetical protein